MLLTEVYDDTETCSSIEDVYRVGCNSGEPIMFARTECTSLGPEGNCATSDQEKGGITSQTGRACSLELEPIAIDILKATSAKLAAAHTLTFTAIETFESLSRQGEPLVYGNKFDVVLQRPISFA